MALVLQRIEEEQKNIRTNLHVMRESFRHVYTTLTPSEARTDKSGQYRDLLVKMKISVRVMEPEEISSIGTPPDTWPPFVFAWSKEFDSINEAAQATETEGSSEERAASPFPGL
jgi:hypothetical protein